MEKNATRYNVQLYIYDLSRGMARSLSPIMLGKQLDGIWHTAIVAYGDEFFFGGEGISSCSPGGTMLGPPDTVVELGETEVSEEIFMEYLSSLGESTYRGDRYRLFEHNCNTFTNEVAQFLTGRSIPSYITDLPSEVLSTPFGQILRPILDSIHIAPPGGASDVTVCVSRTAVRLSFPRAACNCTVVERLRMEMHINIYNLSNTDWLQFKGAFC